MHLIRLLLLIAACYGAVAQPLHLSCPGARLPRGGKITFGFVDALGRPHPNPPLVTDVQFEDFGPILVSTPILRQISATGWMAVIPFTLSGTLAPFPRIITTAGMFTCQGNVLIVTDFFNVVPRVTMHAPGSGRVGDTITITGTFLGPPYDVYFNGVRAASNAVYPPGWTPGQPFSTIRAVVPIGATSGPLTVETTLGLNYMQTPAGAPVPFNVIPRIPLPCQSPPCAQDVTGNVAITKIGTFRFRRFSRQYTQTILIEAPGGIPGPVYVIVDNLSGGTLVGAAGATAAAPPLGSPYLVFPSIPPGGLGMTLTFDVPGPIKTPPAFTVRVLAGPGNV